METFDLMLQSQGSTLAEAAPGQGQEAGTLTRSTTWVAGFHQFEPSPATSTGVHQQEAGIGSNH